MFPTLAKEITDDADPDDTEYYLVLVAGAWFALGFTCMFAILLIALPLEYLAGDAVGRFVGFTLLSGCAFCYAGGVYALWRKYGFIPLARRRLREDGPDSERYARSLRRTYPRNTSLIGQAAVAIATLVVGLGLL